MADTKKRKGAPATWSQIRVYRRLIEANAAVLDATRAYVEKDSGLSLSEFDMLVELGNQPPMGMSKLAARILVSPGNATRVAKMLATKGILSRERAPHSEREVLARLTPEGQTRFERHFPRAASYVADLLDERLTPAEQVKLAELLEKLAR